jgi:hypothetical protein
MIVMEAHMFSEQERADILDKLITALEIDIRDAGAV